MAQITVPIPDIVSSAGTLSIANSGHGYGNNSTNIQVDGALLEAIAMNVVRREMEKLEDVNLQELNTLIHSPNYEDFNLAMSILEAKGCKYSPHMLRGIKAYNNYGLMIRIREYTTNNHMNITDEIL